jgi:RimJ/RimL family protein N-acetyltransferase
MPPTLPGRGKNNLTPALGLHRVEAIIDINNDRSKNLLLKRGFTYEGK